MFECVCVCVCVCERERERERDVEEWPQFYPQRRRHDHLFRVQGIRDGGGWERMGKERWWRFQLIPGEEMTISQ